MDKLVLHCDMNNYFASVECIDKPQLKSFPVAVCGDPAMRHGIVLAKNDNAKKYGITTGESSYAAKQKCPNLVILKPDYPKYLHYASLAREIYKSYTSKVYPYGLDEAWVDLSESGKSFKEGILAADEIRERIKSELKLTASVGVSFNFVFSKLASDMKKPDATSVIAFENYKETVWNMPAFDLLFVGGATRKLLRKIGILTIGDIARHDPKHLIKVLGKKGIMLWEFANGKDSSFNPQNNSEEDIKSVGNTITPPKDIDNQGDAAAFLYVLSCTVAKRLIKHNFKTLCVCIVIRRSDFSIITRQRTIYHPTDDAEVVFKYAYELFCENHNWDLNIRSIGVKTDKLSNSENEQLCLFDFSGNDFKKDKNIIELVNKIKSQYGDLLFERSATSKDADISLTEI